MSSYYEINKEAIKLKLNKYRADNKNSYNEYQNKLYHANKIEINIKRAEKITCECGSICSKSGIAKHRMTKKHLINI